MFLPRVVRYLVMCKMVANDFDVIYRLIVLNERPADVGREYGLTKYAARQLRQRVVEMCLYRPRLARLVVELAAKAFNVVSVPTIVTRIDEGVYKCLKCGDLLFSDTRRIHLMVKHEDLVLDYVDRVIREIKRIYFKRRSSRETHPDAVSIMR